MLDDGYRTRRSRGYLQMRCIGLIIRASRSNCLQWGLSFCICWVAIVSVSFHMEWPGDETNPMMFSIRLILG